MHFNQKLPVYQQKEKILEALKIHNIVIVESPTGSGKTTQLPIILHEAGYTKQGCIGITQPRRIATLSIAEFIAKQLNSELGDFVGYKMRFEDKTSPQTHIKVMTDGTLLQEMKKDKFLLSYKVIMIDEAHERSLNIDFILGLLKTIQNFRRDMKVIVSSATLNTKVFSSYFNNAPIVSIKTPTFPVQVFYDPILPPENTNPSKGKPLAVAYTQEKIYIPTSSITAMKVTSVIQSLMQNRKSQGDILVFLSGEKTIKETITLLNQQPFSRYLHILPLYGRISQQDQQQVFEPTPSGKIKVVIGTNLAETSITIDGISTVIDSGFVKLNHYNHSHYNSALLEQPISQASAAQRSGRAGRTQSGVCYRLYDQKSFKRRPAYTPEEIHRTDLSEVLMHMSELGLTNFDSFPFISHPGKVAIQAAKQSLESLKAIHRDNSLTKLGELMASFPLVPKHARVIVEAMIRYPESLYNVTQGIAFLSTSSPFLFPQGAETEAREAQKSFSHKRGDLVSYLIVLSRFEDSPNQEEFCQKYYLEYKTMIEISNIQKQLQGIIEDQSIKIEKKDSYDSYILAMGTGLIQGIAKKIGRNFYRNLTVDGFSLHPSSFLFSSNPEYIVCGEIVKTTRMFARSVSSITPSEIKLISPKLLENLNVFTKAKSLLKRKIHSSQESKKEGFVHKERNKYITKKKIVFPKKNSQPLKKRNLK